MAGEGFCVSYVYSCACVSPATDNSYHVASRGLGVNFLPAKGFKRGPPHCVETTFSYRYCRFKTVIQWCIAKNRGRYTLEMRDRRCRGIERRRREDRGAEGAEARRVGFLGRGCPPPQPTRGSGGAL